MPTAPPALTARLEARISTDLRAIEQSEVIQLSPADQKCFAQALMSPPQATPALKRAVVRRNKLLRSAR